MTAMLTWILISLNMQISLDFPLQSVRISDVNGHRMVSVDGAVPLLETGEPMFPIKPIFVSIPQGYSVEDVRIVYAESTRLDVRADEILRAEAEEFRTPPDKPSLWMRYVEKIAEPVGTWTSFGYRIGTINFYPLRVDSAGNVYFLTHVDLELELEESGEPYISPRIMRKSDFDYVFRVLSHLVANPDDLRQNAPNPILVDKAGPHSNVFPYVIITQDGLENYFGGLKAIFALEGYPAIVRTISWIESRYEGSDRLEKIRNFIRDMYQNHGTVWVLLGADSPFLPSRMVTVPIGTGYYDDVPTDLYFSCLDGTWDRNGNGHYAELEDSVDLMPDVFVGRVTFQDSAEIANVVRKYLAYVSPNDTTYSAKALFVGADLFSAGDGATLCEELTHQFPDDFTLIRMYESDSHDNSLTDFIDTVNAGVGLVTMEVHGWYTFINLNSTPRVSFTYNHADTLRNVDEPAVFNIISCETGGFDRECIVEHMMRAPGGAIAVLSSTRNNYPYVVQPYNINFYSQLYHNHIREIAALDLMSRSVFVAYAGAYNHSRYVLFSYNLMGMPQLRLWSNVPGKTHITGAPANISVGLQTITFRLVDNDGNGMPHKMVAVFKEGETYDIDTTDASGYAHFTVNPQTAGPLYIATFDPTVTAAIDTIVVTSGLGVPYLMDYDVVEPADGRVNSGDRVSLRLKLGNDGILNYTGITMRFTDSDTAADILTDSIVVDTVYRLDTTIVRTPLEMSIHNGVSDGYVVTMPIQFVRGGQVIGVDTLGLVVNAPRIQLLRTRIEHRVGTQIYKLWPVIGNSGNGIARRVTVHLLPSAGIRVVDSARKVGDVDPKGIAVTENPLRFVLYAPGPPPRIRLKLSADNITSPIFVDVSLTEIDPPESIEVSTNFAGIKLTWAPVDTPSLSGYLVYRSVDGGEFVQITPSPVVHPEYVDMDVRYGVTYRYCITAVDSFMSESPPSDTVEGFYYEELDGWPVVVMGPSAPLITDIDPYPGKEVIIASEDKNIYAFHADGTPVDGWPIEIGGTVITSPAAGDLDGDGYDEVVVLPYASFSGNLKVIKGDGTMLDGWPRYIPGGSWAAPTLYDIDGDGHLEVFIHSNRGKIYAFRWNGQPFLADTDGVFYDLPEYSGGFSEIAIADINNDGAPEVVTGDKDQGIIALTYYGQVLPGFPVPNTRTMTEVAVADFLPNEPGLEIATFSGRNLLYLVTSDGRIASGWPVDIGSNNANFYNFSMHVIASDIDNDGVPELITNLADGIAAYNGDGTAVPGFPYRFHEGMYTEQSPVSADIDGDGQTEAFMVGYYKAFGVTSDGSDYGSFPFDVVSGTHKTAAFDDIDGDGTAEMVIPASDGFIHVLKMLGTWNFNGWPQYQHDPQKTGAYGFIPRRITGISKDDSRVSTTVLMGIKSTVATSKAEFSAMVPSGARVEVRVYSADGRLVWQRSALSSGKVTLSWKPAKSAHNGVYFYRMSVGTKVKTGKFVLLK